MSEYWKGGKEAFFAQFRQYSIIPSFHHSIIPTLHLSIAFVASIDTRKLFVDHLLVCRSPLLEMDMRRSQNT
jgi:hypothetical protein